MRLKDIQNIFHEALGSMFGKEEVESFFFMLIESYYGISRIQLAMDSDYAIDGSEKIINALELLKQQKPIQYILGETEFYGLPFKVNEHTLIPRPETEELVDWIIKCHSKQSDASKINILDIGTGSGCIAISIAKSLTNARVYAIDVLAQPNKSAATRLSMKDNSYGQWVIEIINTLNIENVTMAGFSFGGLIILKTLEYDESKIKEVYLSAPAYIVNGNPLKALFKVFIPMKLFIKTKNTSFQTLFR